MIKYVLEGVCDLTLPHLGLVWCVCGWVWVCVTPLDLTLVWCGVCVGVCVISP